MKISHDMNLNQLQEQERLNTQAHIMTMYSAVRGERIANF